MTRTITVNGRTGRFDVPSFTLAENEALTVTFNIVNEIRAGRYYVVVRHGTAPKKAFVLSADKSIELSAEWLNAGGTELVEFALELRNPAGTLTIKNDYVIEPLIVTSVAGKWTATAYLQKLETELEELKGTVSILSDGYNKLQEIVSGLPAAIEEAKRQAVIEAAGGDPMGA